MAQCNKYCNSRFEDYEYAFKEEEEEANKILP